LSMVASASSHTEAAWTAAALVFREYSTIALVSCRSDADCVRKALRFEGCDHPAAAVCVRHAARR
jgi:hypothetical protein